MIPEILNDQVFVSRHKKSSLTRMHMHRMHHVKSRGSSISFADFEGLVTESEYEYYGT